MKKSKKMLVTALASTMVLIGATRYVQSTLRQVHLNTLLRPEPYHHVNDDPAKEPARKERSWKFYRLWIARDKRDVSAEIAPFLRDESAPLRESAARMLGRLESPAAESHLQSAQHHMTRNNYGRLGVFEMALGRVQSRGLRGQAKVDAVMKSVGLSWNETVLLSEKVKADYAGADAGHRVMKELIDVLYEMGKRGENIQPLVEQLSLYPPQRVLLQGAGLPPDKEARLIVDHLSQINAVTPEDGELAEFYLLNLAPHSTEAILQKLIEMKEGRVQSGRNGYHELFRTVALSQDPRVPALLKHFTDNAEQPMSGYASGALRRFEATKYIGQWTSPRCPWPPLL